MFGNIKRTLSRGFNNPSTDGLVRMFEVEYNKEYRCAVRAGVHIDRQFVLEFLKATK